MTIKLAQFSTNLNMSQHYTDEVSLRDLSNLCFEQISSDISYTGSNEERYEHYVALVTQYRNVFAPHAAQNLTTMQPELINMNAIQYAAYYGYDRFITANRDLIHDALDTPSSVGMTPLHLAGLSGHLHTVEALLSSGADPEKLNKRRQMPIYTTLTLAMSYTAELKNNKEAIFRRLFAANPETVAHKDALGDTVFHAMASHGYTQLLTDLISTDTRGAFYHNNAIQYPIHTAILNNNADIVKLLLTIDQVATLHDSQNRVAIHYAAMYGSKEIIQLCCDATHDLVIHDTEGKTPLMLAMEAENHEAIEVLTERGASHHARFLG